MAAGRQPSKVLVVYTGGTIGMVPRDAADPSSPLQPASMDRLRRYVANPLGGVDWDIAGLADPDGGAVAPLDSSNITPLHWTYLAQLIEKNYGAYDGFVVLHGTDTMAYTASALSFLLKNLTKPVIVTGSQLPIFDPRTDAVTNFANALTIAGHRASGLPPVPEVAICFGDVLLRGNRAAKVSTTGFSGFASANFPPLGKIGRQIVIDPSRLLPLPEAGRRMTAYRRMEQGVGVVTLYPGMTAPLLDAMLKLAPKAFVLRSFGAGNVPDSDAFRSVLVKAAENKKLLINVTQCLQGGVEEGLYATSEVLQDTGVINGFDLTLEAAVAKAMWLLATVSGEDVAARFQTSFRGEQSASAAPPPGFDL